MRTWVTRMPADVPSGHGFPGWVSALGSVWVQEQATAQELESGLAWVQAWALASAREQGSVLGPESGSERAWATEPASVQAGVLAMIPRRWTRLIHHHTRRAPLIPPSSPPIPKNLCGPRDTTPYDPGRVAYERRVTTVRLHLSVIRPTSVTAKLNDLIASAPAVLWRQDQS